VASGDTLDDAAAGPWRQYVDPAEAGFDPTALKAVCVRADSLGSGAFMAVWRGNVIVACGAVDREFRAHSVRKSLVSALYGTAVARGEIDLDATLGQLGIDDDTPLTPTEKEATVRDVISARSGVYLPSAYAPSSQEAELPARGSHPPGTHWYYNNWDFNVAGVIYERATGEDLYASFERRIAEPLGMEDWSPEDGFRVYEPTKSRHPAQTFRISARDLARFGQLYLQQGRWNGRQIVPASWIEESTGPVSEIGGGTAYGYMWWVYPSGSLNPESYPVLSKQSLYLARGSGGQGLWVIPGEDLVVVHRGDTDHGNGVRGPDAWGLVEMVAAARTGEAVAEPRLGPLDPVPLASQRPAPEIPRFRALSDDVVQQYLGRYRLSPDAEIRVFLFQGKPYVHVPGEGDALLFPTGEDRFTIRVVSGVDVSFQRDEDGRVSGLVLTLGPQTMRAEKVGA
jgi:CubicO group peptidase (beta-lactamase class C family)